MKKLSTMKSSQKVTKKYFYKDVKRNKLIFFVSFPRARTGFGQLKPSEKKEDFLVCHSAEKIYGVEK